MRWRVLWPSGGGRWDGGAEALVGAPAAHHPMALDPGDISACCTKWKRPTGVMNVPCLSCQQRGESVKEGVWDLPILYTLLSGFIRRGLWMCTNGADTERGMEKYPHTIHTVPSGKSFLILTALLCTVGANTH